MAPAVAAMLAVAGPVEVVDPVAVGVPAAAVDAARAVVVVQVATVGHVDRDARKKIQALSSAWSKFAGYRRSSKVGET